MDNQDYSAGRQVLNGRDAMRLLGMGSTAGLFGLLGSSPLQAPGLTGPSRDQVTVNRARNLDVTTGRK